ncbi:glycosyltransferase family 2 protein [Rhodocyclus tenuis]|uniref:glycosyltransferase family 2 protein n=1 Tax=Rhodocyclus tenuis TaxID=1066 RepID=UPI0019053297|nr:glycosyltransferase family 2 protein [Rhodocyclus tenuis]MBK1678909.1 hypothetical protein [Rhodocyclus tenuis]
MKFSIVTCTWNSARYLPDTINSLVQQGFDDFEVIFVDGGSTDETLSMIEAYPRPKKLHRDVRGGIARAMNVGIDAAEGDIVAHMHSDDYYLDADVLNRVASHFDATKCRWLFGRIMSDIEGKLCKERYVVPGYSYGELLKHNIVPHAATFVRREVFQELGGFSLDYKLAMDYEMWLRVGRKYEPVQLDDYLAAFRRHPGSATQANRVRSFNEDFRARFEYAPLLKWPEYVLRYGVRRYQLARELGA